jgi:Pyruvate phosphate dikinase, AMP/ATP-binding domain
MVQTYAEIAPSDIGNVGAKAFKLSRLATLTSLPVNPGLVIGWPDIRPLADAAGLQALIDAAVTSGSSTSGRRALHALAAAAQERLHATGRHLGTVRQNLIERNTPGIGHTSTVVVRTSLIHVPRPREELEGIGSSRVCTVAEIPQTIQELLAAVMDPNQLVRLGALGPGAVRIAFLVNPFPEHDVSGICASFNANSGDTNEFELLIGHGQLYGVTRGYTTPDSYLVSTDDASVFSYEAGSAQEAVYLDADRRFVSRRLPVEVAAASVAESALLDIAAIMTAFRSWLDETRSAVGQPKFKLEFCIDHDKAVVITDVLYCA